MAEQDVNATEEQLAAFARLWDTGAVAHDNAPAPGTIEAGLGNVILYLGKKVHDLEKELAELKAGSAELEKRVNDLAAGRAARFSDLERLAAFDTHTLEDRPHDGRP